MKMEFFLLLGLISGLTQIISARSRCSCWSSGGVGLTSAAGNDKDGEKRLRIRNPAGRKHGEEVKTPEGRNAQTEEREREREWRDE